MKRYDGLQRRFGGGASGPVGQAKDSPARVHEGRLEERNVALLQVEVSSGGATVKHLAGGAAGKQ